jgi:hypothetical protein
MPVLSWPRESETTPRPCSGPIATEPSVVKKMGSYYPAYSAVLGTAGGLLFMGDIMGRISVFDKDTIQEL